MQDRMFKSFGRILILSGLIGFVAVVSFGFSIWNSDAGGGENHAGGLFVWIVFGIPALGFLLVSTFLGAVFSSVRRKPSHDVAPDVNVVATSMAEPQEVGSKKKSIISRLGFWVATLWSVPCGFFAFVALITGDFENLMVWLLRWGVVAGTALALHTSFKPAHVQ